MIASNSINLASLTTWLGYYLVYVLGAVGLWVLFVAIVSGGRRDRRR